mmetsp:Transcript_7510/g.9810  ORF Transcript_7510/g.9810 Transcript_7510/m.9810 type:complete len:203 (+) Transcript_7510:41-649(+)
MNAFFSLLFAFASAVCCLKVAAAEYLLKHDLTLIDTSVSIERIPTTVHASGKPLYRLLSDLRVRYSIANSGSVSLCLLKEGTPLSEDGYNDFLKTSKDLYYGGVIAEVVRNSSIGDTICIPAGETSSVELNLGPNSLTVVTSGSAKFALSFLSSVYNSSTEALEESDILAVTNEVTVGVVQEPKLGIERKNIPLSTSTQLPR